MPTRLTTPSITPILTQPLISRWWDLQRRFLKCTGRLSSLRSLLLKSTTSLMCRAYPHWVKSTTGTQTTSLKLLWRCTLSLLVLRRWAPKIEDLPISSRSESSPSTSLSLMQAQSRLILITSTQSHCRMGWGDSLRQCLIPFMKSCKTSSKRKTLMQTCLETELPPYPTASTFHLKTSDSLRDIEWCGFPSLNECHILFILLIWVWVSIYWLF